MSELFTFTFLVILIFSTIRTATPLIFAALGGMFSERSGIINIALEGLMLAGAFTAAVVTFELSQPYMVQNLIHIGLSEYLAKLILSPSAVPFYGLIAGAAAGAFLALIYAVSVIKFEADQVVAGFAINILMIGLPAVISSKLYDSAGSTQQVAIQYLLPGFDQFIANRYALIGVIAVVIVCTLVALIAFYKMIFQATKGTNKSSVDVSPITWVSVALIIIFSMSFAFSSRLSVASVLVFLLVPLCWYVLYKTPFGLRLRAVGENPEAADAAGVSVYRLRYAGVVLSGILAAAGGAYLSIGQSSLFTRGMTAGRGFIALAALILAKWRPWQAMFACLFFGLTEALSIQVQGAIKLPSGEDIPVQFIQMIPYVLTIIVLAGFIGLSRAPKSLGIPYRKEK